MRQKHDVWNCANAGFVCTVLAMILSVYGAFVFVVVIPEMELVGSGYLRSISDSQRPAPPPASGTTPYSAGRRRNLGEDEDDAELSNTKKGRKTANQVADAESAATGYDASAALEELGTAISEKQKSETLQQSANKKPTVGLRGGATSRAPSPSASALAQEKDGAEIVVIDGDADRTSNADAAGTTDDPNKHSDLRTATARKDENSAQVDTKSAEESPDKKLSPSSIQLKDGSSIASSSAITAATATTMTSEIPPAQEGSASQAPKNKHDASGGGGAASSSLLPDENSTIHQEDSALSRTKSTTNSGIQGGQTGAAGDLPNNTGARVEGATSPDEERSRTDSAKGDNVSTKKARTPADSSGGMPAPHDNSGDCASAISRSAVFGSFLPASGALVEIVCFFTERFSSTKQQLGPQYNASSSTRHQKTPATPPPVLADHEVSEEMFHARQLQQGGTVLWGVMGESTYDVVYHYYVRDVGTVVLIVFHVVFVLLLISFYHAIVVDPGQVPANWGFYMGDESKRRRYCKMCNVWKPDRTHHCSICRRCVLNMDHHCPWINNCVGFYNRKYFLLFVIYAWVCLQTVCVYGSVITLDKVFRYLTVAFPEGGPGFPVPGGLDQFVQLRHLGMLIGQGAATLLGCTLTNFMKFHIRLISINYTTIENLEREDGQKSKYDVGYRRNWEQVFGSNLLTWWIPIPMSNARPHGDGVRWRVHYTRLTDEDDELPADDDNPQHRRLLK
ncbi:unnamed protein product [Amoebophrya sp. A120]|nr:unnamed protein product [Amoebophrya sp. A120]|eukprot:GSA120T00002293001.1